MDDAVPLWDAVLGPENLQNRFAFAMNRFNSRARKMCRYALAVDPWSPPRASSTSTAEV